MNKEDIDFLISIQDLEQPEFDNACLERENKRLKKENKQLKEENDEFYKLMEMQNKREYRSKFLKDYQKEKGKNVFPDYDEIYKRYYEYKSRINKTIDFINEHKHLSMFADCREPEEDWIYDLEINANELLEILGDKENETN